MLLPLKSPTDTSRLVGDTVKEISLSLLGNARFLEHLSYLEWKWVSDSGEEEKKKNISGQVMEMGDQRKKRNFQKVILGLYALTGDLWKW